MDDSEKLRRNRMVYYAEDIDRINRIIDRMLELSEAKFVLLIDKDGHMITKRGESLSADEETISALVAGSFAATREMAKLLGEEEFSVLFHQGKKESIQLTSVADRMLLAIIFDDRTTIGMVRLYAQETAARLARLLREAAGREAKPEAETIAEEFGAEAKEKLEDMFGEEEKEKGGGEAKEES